jgi:hypothetical protein
MTIINLILLATLLIVVILEGFNWFAIWAGLPLIMTAVYSEFSLSSTDGDWARVPVPKRLAVMGLIVGVVTVTLYMHITLFFGIGIDETEEGKSPIGYMLSPLYAMMGGGAGYFLGYLSGRKYDPGLHRTGPPAGPGEGPKSH